MRSANNKLLEIVKAHERTILFGELEWIMGESKRELAIRMLKENACMFNSCLAKDELKHFKNYDFVQYLINCLSIPEHNYDNCHNATCKRKSRKDGYEQAVDDFSKDVKELIVDLSVIRFKHIDDLAEQLKAGVTND